MDTCRKNIRTYKGRSVIDFPRDYTVIDIETNGLMYDCCEIIEISALKYANGVKIGSFSTLIKPSLKIDPFITKLTGITDEMVANAPGISESIIKFFDYVGNDILLGYNVNFDVNFLYDNLMRCHGIPLTNSFVDVLRIARRVLPELPNHRQVTLAEHYGISTDGAHRAGNDCEICNACYIRLQEDILLRGITLDKFRER